jgi:hypothetical protein
LARLDQLCLFSFLFTYSKCCPALCLQFFQNRRSLSAINWTYLASSGLLKPALYHRRVTGIPEGPNVEPCRPAPGDRSLDGVRRKPIAPGRMMRSTAPRERCICRWRRATAPIGVSNRRDARSAVLAKLDPQHGSPTLALCQCSGAPFLYTESGRTRADSGTVCCLDAPRPGVAQGRTLCRCCCLIFVEHAHRH